MIYDPKSLLNYKSHKNHFFFCVWIWIYKYVPVPVWSSKYLTISMIFMMSFLICQRSRKLYVFCEIWMKNTKQKNRIENMKFSWYIPFIHFTLYLLVFELETRTWNCFSSEKPTKHEIPLHKCMCMCVHELINSREKNFCRLLTLLLLWNCDKNRRMCNVCEREEEEGKWKYFAITIHAKGKGKVE